MNRTPDTPSTGSEIIHSPALHLGSIAVSDRSAVCRASWFSGTRLKAVVFPALHWLIRHTPISIALLPPRLATAVIRPLYWWPGTRLRKACESVARLAPPTGLRPGPRQIYSRFLGNALGIIENFFALYRQGPTAVLPRIAMQSGDVEAIKRLIATHGGAVLAVPHNVGSAFSALRIHHSFNMLLVAKNPPTIERTRIALEFYERMQLSVLMVRGGNAFALSRVLFKVLRQGKLVAATLDNIDRTGRAVRVRMFGQEVGLAGWAAKIAVKMRVPIVPAWFQSSGRQLRVIVGEPILSGDIQTAVQHYAAFFEQQILADPASWAYLADKHWQGLLAAATASAATGNAAAD
jgi:lauroyl/myristoyl acyltransferase